MVDFRQIREKIWPITQEELPKVLLLIAMKFCVTFVYSILFVCKDTIIITSPGLGTELIPILKGTVMIVAAGAVSALYTRLTSRFSFEKVFYFFLLFFGRSFSAIFLAALAFFLGGMIDSITSSALSRRFALCIFLARVAISLPISS